MKITVVQPHRSSLGMDANMASLIIFITMAAVSWIPYLGWAAWAVPLVFFIMEKESSFVKFQASTALAVGIIRAAIAIVLQIFIWISTPKDLYSLIDYAFSRRWGVWVLLGTISTIIGIAIMVLIIYLAFMAYGYKQVELPIIGSIAKKASETLDNLNVQANYTGTDGQGADDKPVFCSECGAKNAGGTKFCGSCGKPMA